MQLFGSGSIASKLDFRIELLFEQELENYCHQNTQSAFFQGSQRSEILPLATPPFLLAKLDH